jgi:alpha-beta hydrolase superfamily lysophospholipase
LACAGYGVFAMDYPGFGLSEGLHCYIPSFDSLVDDVIEIYSKIKGTLNVVNTMLKLNNANLLCVRISYLSGREV